MYPMLPNAAHSYTPFSKAKSLNAARKPPVKSPAWRLMPVIPALPRLRLENQRKLEVSWDYTPDSAKQTNQKSPSGHLGSSGSGGRHLQTGRQRQTEDHKSKANLSWGDPLPKSKARGWEVTQLEKCFSHKRENPAFNKNPAWMVVCL